MLKVKTSAVVRKNKLPEDTQETEAQDQNLFNEMFEIFLTPSFPISEEDETFDERKLPKSLHLIRHLRPLELHILSST
jgi:hypothetical protein